MKIRYEKDIKDCSECDFWKEWKCEIDEQNSEINNLLESVNVRLPCQLRPCPIEIKEIGKVTKEIVYDWLGNKK